MARKMAETIKSAQKRAQQSDYHASNYTQIGDYIFQRHLGAGSYASVKEAKHKATGMLVAIKIYDKQRLENSCSRKKGVIKEIQSLNKVEHPCLPKLFDVIDSPSQIYLVMECIQGQNLTTLLNRDLFLKNC